jgi:hypothetical protein
VNDLCYVIRMKCDASTRDRCGAAEERIRLELTAYAERLAAFYTEGARPAVEVKQLSPFAIIDHP